MKNSPGYENSTTWPVADTLDMEQADESPGDWALADLRSGPT